MINIQSNSKNKKIVYFNVCKNLILSDLLIFKQLFINKFINFAIWISLQIFVTGYIMPYFGMNETFGVFQFCGILAVIGLLELYGSVVSFISDLQNDRSIDYSLTLPIPSFLVIVSKVGYYFLIYFYLSICMVPIGKLLLWNQLDLWKINYFKLLLAFICQCLFSACYTIFLATFVDNIEKMGNLWSRFIFPMWFMGGFQFSWIALYKVLPIVAWIDLINPIVYATESTRAAMLGQDEYLNYWFCLAMITLFSFVCLYVGILRLKKRLDYV